MLCLHGVWYDNGVFVKEDIMSYVVTWWEGDVRHHTVRSDTLAAHETAKALRKSSDALVYRSLVPIRVMDTSVWERMQLLEKAHDVTRCKHGLLHVCVKCLTPSA